MPDFRRILVDFIISKKILFTYSILFRYFFNSKNVKKIRQQNIMMLHAGRTGSSVLADLLNQHEQIKWDGEIYFHYPKYLKFFTTNPIKFLNYRTFQKSSKFYGFEIKALEYQHLDMFIRLDLPEYLTEIEKLGFNKYIFLIRNNLLQRYISILQMLESGLLHSRTKQAKPRKIKINVNKVWDQGEKLNLVEYLRVFDKRYKWVEEILKGKNVLILSYEDDIKNDPLIGYKKVCNFLQVEVLNPEVKLKRTNPFSLKETIENYSDVEKALINTEFEWMLELDS
jgi:hypothetical protein